jgi:hypothetical protein
VIVASGVSGPAWKLCVGLPDGAGKKPFATQPVKVAPLAPAVQLQPTPEPPATVPPDGVQVTAAPAVVLTGYGSGADVLGAQFGSPA